MNLTSRLTSSTNYRSASSTSLIEILLLQGTVEKQREQIRDLDSELSNVKADLEELKGQNDRLSTSNKVRNIARTVLEICHKN